MQIEFSMNRIALFIALLICGFGGCNNRSPTPAIEVDDLVATFASVSNESALDVEHVVTNAANSERAIMFIHVDWAFTKLFQPKYAEFIIDYHAKHPDDNLLFHYVDCTPVTHGYKPLRKLPGWQELMDDAGNALIHGGCEIVWMERGRVLHVQRITDFDSASDLIELTEKIMPVGG